MKVRSMAYGRTFNNGNFESSRIDFTVDLYEDENAQLAFSELIAIVEDARDQELKTMKK